MYKCLVYAHGLPPPPYPLLSSSSRPLPQWGVAKASCMMQSSAKNRTNILFVAIATMWKLYFFDIEWLHCVSAWILTATILLPLIYKTSHTKISRSSNSFLPFSCCKAVASCWLGISLLWIHEAYTANGPINRRLNCFKDLSCYNRCGWLAYAILPYWRKFPKCFK